MRAHLIVSALSSLLIACLAPAAPPRPPNILVIIADDLGWADVGYHGSEIDTPNIDRLAREGVILENHYVTPMCSSTRACLLSGRYSTRFGLDSATNNLVFPLGMETLASALQNSGYRTGITGKWHLGSKSEWGPLQFGFDHSYGAFAGGVDQYLHLYKKGPYQKTWQRDHKLIEEEGHATDLIANEAISWINDNSTNAPFYIQVAFTAVHVPIQEPKKWVAPYEDRIENDSRRRFAACTTHMDDAIGKIVDALDSTGQRNNTLILFTSDNGGSGPWKPSGLYPGEYRPSPVLGNNAPLRGQKGTIYEGGIRVPAFITWPGVLNPRKMIHPVHVVDWMPTFLALNEINSTGTGTPDGRNIWPLLAGHEKFPETRTLYFKRGKSVAVRRGRWKLVHHNGAEPELYNLQEDPNETTDIAASLPERVTKLLPHLSEQKALDQSGPTLDLN